MRKVINISIPEPCHENWSTMTPKEKGRHCAVCEKTVFDFTKQSDEQIITTFEQQGNLCGRFKSSQLNRELVLSRYKKNNYLGWAASGLFAFLSLGTQEALAQQPTTVTQRDTVRTNSVIGKIAASTIKGNLISGTVLDESGLPLPGANIIIKNTSKGTQSDFDGRYSIQAIEGEVLVVSYVGYENKEIIISKSNVVNVVLDQNDMILGGMVIVGFSKVKTPKHVCSPEELERKKINKQRNLNRKKFYQRKFMEDKSFRKLRRNAVKNGETSRTHVGKFLYNVSKIFRSGE